MTKRILMLHFLSCYIIYGLLYCIWTAFVCATEYEVISTTKGPDGDEQVSILTTNQTHTAVENLRPESRYYYDYYSGICF